MEFDQFGLPINSLLIGEEPAPEVTALIQESTRANGKALLTHRGAASLVPISLRKVSAQGLIFHNNTIYQAHGYLPGETVEVSPDGPLDPAVTLLGAHPAPHAVETGISASAGHFRSRCRNCPTRGNDPR